MELVDCVDLTMKIMGKEIRRPMLIVRGITHCEGLIGWDTIAEEGITLEGGSATAYFQAEGAEHQEWRVAALVAGRRTVVPPRTVQKFRPVAMLQDTHLEAGEQGICEPLPNTQIGMWDCIAEVGEHGYTTVTVINASSIPITIKAGEQVGLMRNPETTGEEIRPLDHKIIASIMGKIGEEPAEPGRGLTVP